MRIRKLLPATLLAIPLALTACDRPILPDTSLPGNNPAIQLHAEWEVMMPHGVWEIHPPSRLDIIMIPDGNGFELTAAERCATYGGSTELIFYPKTDQFICEGIDY